jgi:hypothetical protein
MKWEYNKQKLVGDRSFIRLYTICGKRLFNFLFNIEDWQGDGYVRATLIIWNHAIQLVIPFDNNKRHIDFRFSLLSRK